MVDYSSGLFSKLRYAGQKLGILRPMMRMYRQVTSVNYEQAFDNALMDEIKSGDVVWDVGANIGFYTQKFAEKVGARGCVVAFEPSPRTTETLRLAVSFYGQVKIATVALSDRSGSAGFVEDAATHATNSLAIDAKDGDVIHVETRRGDEFAKEICPNVIKIDVEGFEAEVVEGLSQTLSDHRLRAVFIEVHFLEISKRGLRDGVSRLKTLLENSGLSVRWLDPSHIVARRTLQ